MLVMHQGSLLCGDLLIDRFQLRWNAGQARLRFCQIEPQVLVVQLQKNFAGGNMPAEGQIERRDTSPR